MVLVKNLKFLDPFFFGQIGSEALVLFWIENKTFWKNINLNDLLLCYKNEKTGLQITNLAAYASESNKPF